MPSTLLALVLALAEPLAGRPARVHVHPRIRPQPPAAASVPKMRYYGGRVLQDAQLVAVLWGPPLPADLQARLDAWYAAFVRAPQWQWLGEYGTAGVAVEGGGAGTNQRLNPPTYLGSFVVQPANQRTTLSEPELEAELAAQIDKGALPPPGPGTLYVLHMPTGITLADGQSVSCVAYCAYHDSFIARGQSLPFAVLPSHAPGTGCAVCGESADWFENLGGSISHEITEGVTDPDVVAVSSGCGSAWCDPQPGDALTPHAEIGDICETGSVTLYRFRDAQGATFAAQREWSNVAKACLGTAADAFSVALDPAEVWLPAGVPAQVQVSTTRPASGAALLDLGVPQPPAGLAVQLKASQIDAGSPRGSSRPRWTRALPRRWS